MKTVGMRISHATTKNGTATPAPALTTSCGRSRRITRIASHRLRTVLGRLRVVGEYDVTTRSPWSRSTTSGVSGHTHSRSRSPHQDFSTSSWVQVASLGADHEHGPAHQ